MITFECNMLIHISAPNKPVFQKIPRKYRNFKKLIFFFNYIVKLVKMTEQILQMKYLEAKYKTATYKVILNRPWL